MPFCPDCRDEFVAGVTICPDCEKALVDDLSAVPVAPVEEAPPDPGPPGRIVGHTPDDESAAEAVALLQSVGVPARVGAHSAKGVAVETPEEFGARAEWILRRAAEERRDRPPVTPEDLALLEASKGALLQAGSAAVEGLVRVLVRGPDAHVGAAATRLAQLGDDGVDALRHALTEAVKEDHQPIRQASLRALVLCRHRALPSGLVRLTGDGDPEVRTRAVRVLAALGEGAAMPHVVPLLRDSEAAVREEAADAVWELTGGGVDLDFDADPETTEAYVRELEERYRG